MAETANVSLIGVGDGTDAVPFRVDAPGLSCVATGGAAGAGTKTTLVGGETADKVVRIPARRSFRWHRRHACLCWCAWVLVGGSRRGSERWEGARAHQWVDWSKNRGRLQRHVKKRCRGE